MKMILVSLILISFSAFAKETKTLNAVEKKMMAACNSEYAAKVKGMNFHQVFDWVETEERGTDADTFKKSKCYTLHEDAENSAGKESAPEKKQ
jgi:hypothetical protein